MTYIHRKLPNGKIKVYKAMQIKFKKEDPRAVMPFKAHPTDAGSDFTAISSEYDYVHKTMTYHTGIDVEIPAGYVGLVFARSSVYKTCMVLSNGTGVVDAPYRGEVKAVFYCENAKPYENGDRIFQMVVVPIVCVEWVEADELSETDRGTGGYGSTGK